MARVLKPGGIVSFLTITYPHELSRDELKRAIELGSEEGQSGPGFRALMAEAGFKDIAVEDVTSSYRATLGSLIEAWESDADEIRPLVGDADFVERMQRRRNSRLAIGEGLHVRQWVSGRLP